VKSGGSYLCGPGQSASVEKNVAFLLKPIIPPLTLGWPLLLELEYVPGPKFPVVAFW